MLDQLSLVDRYAISDSLHVPPCLPYFISLLCTNIWPPASCAPQDSRRSCHPNPASALPSPPLIPAPTRLPSKDFRMFCKATANRLPQSRQEVCTLDAAARPLSPVSGYIAVWATNPQRRHSHMTMHIYRSHLEYAHRIRSKARSCDWIPLRLARSSRSSRKSLTTSVGSSVSASRRSMWTSQTSKPWSL